MDNAKQDVLKELIDRAEKIMLAMTMHNFGKWVEIGKLVVELSQKLPPAPNRWGQPHYENPIHPACEKMHVELSKRGAPSSISALTKMARIVTHYTQAELDILIQSGMPICDAAFLCRDKTDPAYRAKVLALCAEGKRPKEIACHNYAKPVRRRGSNLAEGKAGESLRTLTVTVPEVGDDDEAWDRFAMVLKSIQSMVPPKRFMNIVEQNWREMKRTEAA